MFTNYVRSLKQHAVALILLTSLSTNAQASLRLNELLARNHSYTNPITREVSDWVELKNHSSQVLDLAGYSLTDRTDSPRKWEFPAGLGLSAYAFLVVSLNADLPATLAPVAELNAGFSLKWSGDTLYLFDVTAATPRLVDQLEFGTQVADLSLARESDTGEWKLSTPTPGFANTPVELGDSKNLRINEWMANASRTDDWIELYNPGSRPVALEGLFLSDDPKTPLLSRISPLSFIGVGAQAFAVFLADNQADKRGNHLKFKLSASGESILLATPNATVIDQIKFDSQKLDFSEGRLPDGSSTILRLTEDGTLGQANLLPLDRIVISEVLSHSDDPLEDCIELQNLRAESVDISGWYLSDNPEKPTKFQIPAGTVIEPGGFAVFYRYQFQPRPGVSPSFGFNSAHGDDLYLYSANRDGSLTGHRTGTLFVSAPNGFSFGRHLTSLGPRFSLMDHLTLGTDVTATSPPDQTPLFRLGKGQTNSSPLIETVVITEIMYHPTAEQEGDNLEFVELRSLSTTNVPLYDVIFFTNTFRLTGAVRYQWPTNAVLAPGETMLVVGFDPDRDTDKLARFRARYQPPAGTKLFGPFAGKLNNEGATLSLYRPDIPQFCFDADFGFVAPILMDQVDYKTRAPWPSAATGNGSSLQRRWVNHYGDDPVNWYAATPTAGRANDDTADAIPRIKAKQPISIQEGDNISLEVSDSAGLQIQWRLNGSLIDNQTQGALILPHVTPDASGTYSALVSSATGATNIDFVVSVLAQPTITQQPRSLELPPGETAILTVSAKGTPPFRYQWLKGKSLLAEATNATLTISNLTPANRGRYQVIVSTPAGDVSSEEAEVSIATNRAPSIVVHPQGEDFRAVTPVIRGGTFTLRVVAAGEPPLTYQWLHGEEPLPDAKGPSLTLSDFSEDDLGSYRVRVQNAYGSILSLPVAFNFLHLPTVEIMTPDKIVVNPGESINFPTLSTGTPRLYYRWMVNGVEVPAEYCEDYTLPEVGHPHGGEYQVRCFNKRGEVILGTGWSKTVQLSVRPKIRGIEKVGDRVRLSCDAMRHQTYAIEATRDFKVWTKVGEIGSGDQTHATAEFPSTGEWAFFRLTDL